jgi:hypothetical protein
LGEDTIDDSGTAIVGPSPIESRTTFQMSPKRVEFEENVLKPCLPVSEAVAMYKPEPVDYEDLQDMKEKIDLSALDAVSDEMLVTCVFALAKFVKKYKSNSEVVTVNDTGDKLRVQPAIATFKHFPASRLMALMKEKIKARSDSQLASFVTMWLVYPKLNYMSRPGHMKKENLGHQMTIDLPVVFDAATISAANKKQAPAVTKEEKSNIFKKFLSFSGFKKQAKPQVAQ